MREQRGCFQGRSLAQSEKTTMKRIATAALALSFATTSGVALAQDGLAGRLARQVQEQQQKSQSEQPKSEPAPPRQRPEGARPAREAATQQVGPAVRTDDGPRPERGDGGRFGGRRGGGEAAAAPQVVVPTAPAPQTVQIERRERRAPSVTTTAEQPVTQAVEEPRRREGGRTRELQSQPPVATQTAPSRSGPVGEAIDNLRREQERQARRGDRDGDGWNRDGGRGGWDRDGRGPNERPSWATRDGRHDRDRNRPRYDPRRYHHDWRASRRYRVPIYVIPYGYYDNYWRYDDYLPWGWYGPRYWIDDWYRYGLPPPPAGYEWVRVGRDAMLVDIFDGRIRSVVRLLFW
jgi:Ni/Co efflux regulator RcnB